VGCSLLPIVFVTCRCIPWVGGKRCLLVDHRLPPGWLSAQAVQTCRAEFWLTRDEVLNSAETVAGSLPVDELYGVCPGSWSFSSCGDFFEILSRFCCRDHAIVVVSEEYAGVRTEVAVSAVVEALFHGYHECNKAQGQHLSMTSLLHHYLSGFLLLASTCCTR